MALETIFCNHYRAMYEHDTCAAGVAYESLKPLPFDKRPCFRKKLSQVRCGCELQVFPTEQELEEREQRMMKRFAATAVAMAAIEEHLGGPWKRGVEGSSGVIDCPVCGKEKTLRFSRAGYNGHIHGKCGTDGCVSWMQ